MSGESLIQNKGKLKVTAFGLGCGTGSIAFNATRAIIGSHTSDMVSWGISLGIAAAVAIASTIKIHYPDKVKAQENEILLKEAVEDLIDFKKGNVKRVGHVEQQANKEGNIKEVISKWKREAKEDLQKSKAKYEPIVGAKHTRKLSQELIQQIHHRRIQSAPFSPLERPATFLSTAQKGHVDSKTATFDTSRAKTSDSSNETVVSSVPATKKCCKPRVSFCTRFSMWWHGNKVTPVEATEVADNPAPSDVKATEPMKTEKATHGKDARSLSVDLHTPSQAPKTGDDSATTPSSDEKYVIKIN